MVPRLFTGEATPVRHQAQTVNQRILLVGGGHANAVALRMLAMAPLPGTDLVLISDASRSAYSGMLPGFVEGRYTEAELFIDLRRLASACGARFIQATANGLDPSAKRVFFSDHPGLAYDVLSLNVGSTPALSVPGAAAWAIPVKPIAPFLNHWQQLANRVAAGSRQEHIVIVGGGAGGVELALAIHTRLRGQAKITLLQSAPRILPAQAASASALLTRRLRASGIDVRLNTQVTAVTAGQVTVAGQTLSCTALYWVTDASAPTWLKDSGLALDHRGFVRVNRSLACLGQTQVFATGDCATIEGAPLPKAGVFAVRQGRPLALNLHRSLTGKALVVTAPRRRYLALIGTADGHAVAIRGHWSASGRWVQRIKERIDRRFINLFKALPVPMAASKRESEQPGTGKLRCHGCGAKVSGAILSQVLRQIELDYPGVVRSEPTAWGLHEREDTSLFALPAQSRLLQSIDYFPALVDDPYLAGRLACIHGFSDIIAKGGAPHSAHVLAVMALAASHLIADDLYQTLAGIATELQNFNAQLLGGHTAEGEQAALGLMVNGLATASPVRKDTGLAGDALILVKPLGTGLIFAAAMQGCCPSLWVDAALTSMLRTQGELWPLLARPTIHAATDVTGFGLLGHLAEMLRGERLRAVLSAASIPCLPGSLALAAQGFKSSLFDENSRILAKIGWPLGAKDHRVALWCDPQTCGGILLSVAPGAAAELVSEIRTLGYPQAAVIGYMAHRGPTEALVSWASEPAPATSDSPGFYKIR